MKDKYSGFRAERERKHQERLQKIENYNLNPNRCLQCNNPLLYDKRKNKFCHHSCSASYTNKSRVRSVKICLVCGNKTENLKYCNHKCYLIGKKEQARKIIEKNQNLISKSYKWRLKEIRGNKCEICGISEWQNKSIVLHLDHINGDSDNNYLNNVRLLCPNCHSQTSTYAGRNMNGKSSQRKKYNRRKGIGKIN